MNRDGEIYYRLPDGTVLYRAEIEECFMHARITAHARIHCSWDLPDKSKLVDLFDCMEFHDAPIKAFKATTSSGVTVDHGWAWVITDVWSSFLHSELQLTYANRFKHTYSGPWLHKGLQLERPLRIDSALNFQAKYVEHEEYVDDVSVVLRGFFARTS